MLYVLVNDSLDKPQVLALQLVPPHVFYEPFLELSQSLPTQLIRLDLLDGPERLVNESMALFFEGNEVF